MRAFRALLFLALVLASCTVDSTPASPLDPHGDIQIAAPCSQAIDIRLYLTPGFREATAETVLAGCGLWAQVGVSCRLVMRGADANVLVRYEPRTLEGIAGGLTIDPEIGLGVTFYAGWWASTQWPMPTTAEREAIALVLVAHELGHALGLGHIPDGDDTVRAPVHPVYGPLVGLAVMNAALQRAIIEDPHLTLLDVHYFEIRNVRRSQQLLRLGCAGGRDQ